MSNSISKHRQEIVVKCSECLEEKPRDKISSINRHRYICDDCEDDEDEDFVHLEFQKRTGEVIFLGTSSKEYSQEIHDRIFGEADHGHIECQRVEDEFPVDNCIELQKHLTDGDME